MSSESEIYDTVLMRDTCGNARTKVKNYFYHNIYDKKNFKYLSAYDELILLDVLEGKKKQKEYLKRLIPFLIFIVLAALSFILWMFMCYCSKNPKGCLKRYSKANKKTRRICFFIYYGFVTTILILLIISFIYLFFSREDLNGTICTLSMLRYEMMYGQSLLARKKFKKPFWYGITSLSEDIQKVQDLLGTLASNCDIINTDTNLIKDSNNQNNYDIWGKDLKEQLEILYNNYKDLKITNSNPLDSNAETIPLYIYNLGYKENNESYTGRILYDYQIHYEYLIETITEPMLEICEDLVGGNTDLIDALEEFQNVISTLEESMNIVTNYITSYLSKYLVNLKNLYFIFFFIFIALMSGALIVLSILFAIYYFKSLSSLYSSINSMLHLINFLMIFCLFFSGVTGVFSIYFSNASDIIDCAYSAKNIGSDNPRIITRTTPSSVLDRCIRGDGNLLDEYSNDNARKTVESLKKLNSIYIATQDAYKRINSEEKNVYNSFISIEQIIKDFTFMKDEFSLTTSRNETGDGDINYMLNELNRYSMSGMKYQTVCDTSTYVIWTLRDDTSPFVQIDRDDQEIEYKSIESTTSDPSTDYANACTLDSEQSPSFSTAKDGVSKYYQALKNYYDQNIVILDNIINGNWPTGAGYDGLGTIKQNFENYFITNMKTTITNIKEKISDPFWEVFGELVNDTTNYTGIEDAEKIDILGWVNCSILGKDYNVTMNTIKTIFVADLRVVTYCSLIAEGLIIILYFIIISLANNIRDKDLEKTENKYDVESKKDDGEIFEIVENNKYKEKYDYEGELITISKSKKNKKSNYISTSEGFNYKNDKTNDITKDEDLISARKNLPEHQVTVPKFDIAENIEAIKNVDVKKLIDKQGKAVMHPIRISINSPLGVMEASDKYAHKYTYDIFESFHEDESENNNSGIENGSFYQKNKGKKKKGKKKKGNGDKQSKESDSFSF